LHSSISAGLLLAWLVYFYLVNERPLLWPAFVAIIVIQGAVAIGQFFAQRDLGLIALGELPLDPIFEGSSVVAARGRPWLRGYGLTAHPNLLGAMLALLLLLLLPTLRQARRPLRYALEVAALGLLGLLVSFSRAGWLAFGAGWRSGLGRLLERRRQSETPPAPFRFSWDWLLLLVPLLILAVLLSGFDLRPVAGAGNAAGSALYRRATARCGAGVGDLRRATLARRGAGAVCRCGDGFNPEAARVHNVTLLVAAELGIRGLVCYGWSWPSPPSGW
jgi:hypothetical protein